ncbi:hypothetical protein JTE90_009230 [Oedothorax gibbosus]|uniref:Uncharacterized protein n=1 Tax=Oedothorax gibbosus TaxID=931172 RepID=A0AAV6UQA5_9ARAC|nr:hypothetical protein JTE90_009230 [Oedothorax gibbosus]
MLPVRSYSVRMKRRNREAAASFRKNTARRKVGTAVGAASTSTASHVLARRTVSAGSALPSEAKPAPSSPSTKSVSSEPGISTTKDLKFETVLEEDGEDNEVEENNEDHKDDDKVEDKKVDDKVEDKKVDDKKVEDKIEDGGGDKDEAVEKEEVVSPDKGHVKFEIPEEDKFEEIRYVI